MKRISFDEVAKNNLKTGLLFLIFFGIVLGLGVLAGVLLGEPYSGIGIAFFVFLIYSLIAWFKGKNIALSATGAQKAPEKDYKQLHNVVEEMSIAAGIPKPEVYIIEDRSMNAFATGINTDNAAVAITTGLLEQLNREELTGVIAHEIAHIKLRDTRTMLLAGVLVGSIVLLSDIIFRMALYGGNNKDGRMQAALLAVGVVLIILAPFIGQLIKLAISRKREFAADAEAATLTRNPGGLASALEKLTTQYKRELDNSSQALQHMYIVGPETKSWLKNLFRTHPPTEERIKRLNQM